MAKAKKQQKQKFPKEIYVGWDGEPPDEVMLADEHAGGLCPFSGTKEIALYERKKTGRVHKKTIVKFDRD